MSLKAGQEFLERNPQYYFELDDNAEELKLLTTLSNDKEVIVKSFKLADHIYIHCAPDLLINELLLELKNAESAEAMHNISDVIAQIKQDAYTA